MPRLNDVPKDPKLQLHRRRIRRPTPVDPDAIRATEQAYARNLFLGTPLRLLEPRTLNVLEDADIAREWAAERECSECEDDAHPSGQHMRQHLRRWLAVHGAPRRVPSPRAPVSRNLRFVADLLRLGPDEAAVFQFLVVVHRSERLQEVTRSFGEVGLSDALKILAAATRLAHGRVAACLAPGARLRRSGLVTVEPGRDMLTQKLGTRVELADLVFLPVLDRDTFVRAFLESAGPPSLSRDDFSDRTAVELASTLVREAVRTGARGVNLLLHGSTGVGKTELARLIGHELGLQVLSVGRADALGESATPVERLSSLRLALQLAPRGQSILLFDELEDLFRWELDLFSASRAAPQMSKQWFGSLLEENELPIVWCTNRIAGIDPAFLRRFTYAVELKAPGVRQRAKVLARHLGDEHPLPAADVDAIAQRFDASPAQLATAVRGARLVAPGGIPDRTTLERLLAPVHRAITGVDATLRPVFEPSSYHLDALRCGEDLPALADEVSRFVPGPGPGVSLCLYGPPGTGKSEFVKYLAWRCGRPLVQRRVSDLVSPWVGQTEKNIAAAFEEARQDGSLLLFDEADSFLRDRGAASRSWEVREVNEFLQQLEAFPGVVACTTNLWRDIDEAALRRFVFKLEFRFPAAEQTAALFRSFFPDAFAAAGPEPVLRAMGSLPNLAPGDFAAVARRVRATASTPAFGDLVRLLAGETGVKRDAGRAVGFAR